MRDDDDGGNRPEDPTAPELGTDEPPGPPRPSTDEGDYPQDVRAAWAAHYAEIKRKIDAEVDKELEGLKAQARERGPPE